MHGAGDDGSSVQGRGSINRRTQGKNQRDGPSGSQARGGTASQLSASSQGKQAHGNVGNTSATGMYQSASKNSRQLASNVSQGGTPHQQRSNSKAYNHADDNQMQPLAGTLKGTSKNQTISSGKLNRRAGSGQVDAGAVTSDYTKASAKGGQGGSQLYPGQHPAGIPHSSSANQPLQSHHDSFSTAGGPTAMPPSQPGGSHLHMGYQGQHQQPSSNLEQQ